MAPAEDHDYFAFEQHDPPSPPEAGDEIERPEGEDDLTLFDPVLEALKTVRDPEIPVDLVNLGLIYELMVKKGGIVFVEMTLTTPSCPVAASMPDEVKTAISGVESLIEHRASVEGPGTPAPSDLLRLSTGIEDPQDLIDDLDRALRG